MMFMVYFIEDYMYLMDYKNLIKLQESKNGGRPNLAETMNRKPSRNQP